MKVRAVGILLGTCPVEIGGAGAEEKRANGILEE
jgi:hypothetical protein